MNTKLLFLPSWILDTLKANKGQVNQLLDYSYVKNVLSSNDLAEAVYFSEHAATGMLDIETNRGLPVSLSNIVSTSLMELWSTSGKGAQPTNGDVEKIRTYIAINDCERSLNERLFTPTGPVELDKSFEILHFDMEVIGVVIYPGAFTPGQSDENRFVLIRTLVLELTRLNPQEAVANTLLMRRYIELLAAR